MSDTPSAPAAIVLSTRHGDMLCITVNNPPVNAISSAIRHGLKEAVEAADVDDSVKAIVIVGEGANFVAGADIREFGQPPQPPSLPEVCNRIEACGKPVVAAIRGAALGGGLEIALSAHYRIALNDAKLGLPEVQLGLMPGAGGTVRTPRLIGAQAALDMMLSGRHVKAKEALSLGLVDRLADGEDALAAGLAYAQELLVQGAAMCRTSEAQGLADRTAAQAAIDAAKADTAKKSRNLFSPMKIVDAVQASLDKPFDEALKLEREAFLACIESPQRAGLIHAFIAEREVTKVPDPPRQNSCRLDKILNSGAMMRETWRDTDRNSKIER